MDYTIYSESHKDSETVSFDTLKELAQYLVEEYEYIEGLCCIEDEDGRGFNAVDLVKEQLETHDESNT
jgi:hypothetical protein